MKKENNSKYKFLLKNTFLFTIANFSNKLIIFFLLPFYTAFLTTEEYAIIDIISVVQQLVFPILTLDITESVIRFGIEKENNKKNVFIIGLLFILIGNIVLGLGCLLAISFSISVKRYIIYFLIFNIVISANTLYSSFLRAIDKVKLITIASIINTLVTTSLNILLIAKFKYGVDGYYISFIVGNIVSFLIMFFSVKKECNKSNIDISNLKLLTSEMLKYSLPLIPNALFWWVNSSLDRFFLTALSGLSYVGMYAAANKIPSILNTLTSIVQQAWGLSLFKEKNSESKKKFFDNVFKFYNEFIFLASLSLIAFTKIICSIMLSNEFFNSWVYVPVLIMGFYFNSISSFVGTEFTAAKKTSWILITTFISAIVNIILNILLIKNYSCMGAAIATCISYFALLEVRLYILNKKFNLEISNKSILMNSFLLLCMICSLIFNNALFNFLVFLLLLIIICICKRKYYKSLLKLFFNILRRRHE